MFTVPVIVFVNVVVIASIIIIICIERSTIVPAAISGGCTASITFDLRENSPLILVSKKLGTAFREPIHASDELKFETGETVRLVCPGEDNYLVNTGEKEAEASCVIDSTFGVDYVEYQFTDFACSIPPRSSVRAVNRKCLGSYSEYEIGFVLEKDRAEMLKTIEICRDDSTLQTYYSKARLSPGVVGRQRREERRVVEWSQGGGLWQKYNLTSIYNSRSFSIPKSAVIASRIEPRAATKQTSFRLRPGQLTSGEDFVYDAAQSSASWYLNSAPQWTSFDDGNWLRLEEDIRNLVGRTKTELDVYTGVHGIATLLGDDNLEHPLFLVDSGAVQAFAVPKFFWKIIFDPRSGRGTAFVGLNNPFLRPDQLLLDSYICNDISHRIDWLTWDPDKQTSGISYACTIEDLRKVVATVPELRVVDILT